MINRNVFLLTLLSVCLAITIGAQAEWVVARPAESFVDSIGVCTHWRYTDTPYYTKQDDVMRLVAALGVRHVRDGLTPEAEKKLWAQYGIRTTAIVEPDMGPLDKQRERWHDCKDAIAMLEGPNEPNGFWISHHKTYQGKAWPEGLKLFQQDFYKTLKNDPALAGIQVIAPSVLGAEANSQLAPFDAFDNLVMHSYAGGHMPSSSLPPNILTSMMPLGKNGLAKPIVATESGYHNCLDSDITLGPNQPGVSEAAEAKYLPRHFAEYYAAGVVRTFSYEFVNESQMKNHEHNAEANFGMINWDLSPKPSYLALQRLVSLLNEGRWDAGKKVWVAPSQAAKAVNLQITSDTGDVHSVLLRQSNGYSLLLWREVESFDLKTKTLVTYPKAKVQVTLPTAVTSASLWQLTGPGQAVQSWKKTRQFTFDVPDEVVVLKFTYRERAKAAANMPAEAHVTKATSTSIQLAWPAAKEATAYIVSRFGHQLGVAGIDKATGIASFTDIGLIPARRYPYDIQAVNSQGNLSAARSLIADTTDEICDMTITELGWEPAVPKAGDQIKLYAVVKNIGNAPTPAKTTVGVYFKIDDAFACWSTTITDSLQPGESRRVTPDGGPTPPPYIWTATAGKHAVYAKVDDINRFVEGNENNNRLDKVIDVTP